MCNEGAEVMGCVTHLAQDGVCDPAAVEGADALFVAVAEGGGRCQLQAVGHHGGSQPGIQEFRV